MLDSLGTVLADDAGCEASTTVLLGIKGFAALAVPQGMTDLGDGFNDRLNVFMDGLGRGLRSDTQRARFAEYVIGLLSDAERKSLEPLAARLCPDPGRVDAAHQALHYFVCEAPWNDRQVRRTATGWALWAATSAGAVRRTIVDDTGLLKQGTESVGVARQYTGSAGKITNCQVAPTLVVTTDHDVVPVDIALYLPEGWTNDPARLNKVHVPSTVQFRTKAELAMDMLRAARADGVPLGEVVHADADYGRSREFRDMIHEELGLRYVVGVHGTQRVWDTEGVWCAPIAVDELAAMMAPEEFRRVTWRKDTNGDPLSGRFAARRVYAADGSEPPTEATRAEWLIIEWRDGEEHPARFYLATLPADWTLRQLVQELKERWRTERFNEDLKGELGFDHFEGRSWVGWHHHMSVVFACYALLVAERIVAFPPSAPCTPRANADRCTA